MNVGVLKIQLRIPENLSLKGKRQAIRPIIAQIANRFHVSVAEVGNQDLWQIATIGVAVVSDDSRYSNEVLSKVMDFVAGGNFDVEILGHETEIIHV